MTPRRRDLALVALAGIAASVALVLLVLKSFSAEGDETIDLVVGLGVGWAFIGTGMFAHWRRPHSAFGALMAVVGFAWMFQGLVYANDGWLFTIGVLLGYVYVAAFLQMLLSFPDGRLESAWERRLVVAGYVISILGPLPTLLFAGTYDYDCACPGSRIQIADWHTVWKVGDWLTSIAGVALVGVAVYVLLRRFFRASGPRRRATAMLLWPGACLLVLLAGTLTSQIVDGPPSVESATEVLSLVFLTLTPFLFLAGLMRSRVAGAAAVSGLLRRMGTPAPGGTLRDLLADALQDPSLEIAYWLDERGRHVDASGRAVALPAEDDPVRAATEVRGEGHAVGAIVHDRMLAEDPALMESIAGAAALAMANERLAAQLRARVEELRASRARIIEAGTAERRRLERNLHDGAQQRLVALSLTMRAVRTRVRDDPDGAEALLAAAGEELAQAQAELRELARGIHPAVLSDQGLDAAIEGLARRTPIPVAVRDELGERLPPVVEAAAYFVVAEALTNVVKYAGATSAEVRVSRVDGHAVVEVADDGRGGADPARGSGLIGLADRVGALDGRLEVDSPPGAGTRLRASIPV
jgi:signal transduction histidine kinase